MISNHSFKGGAMKVLFLILTFLPMILAVQAQKQVHQYVCQISHKHSKNAFYLNLNSRRKVMVGGWKLYAGITARNEDVEVSITRIVNVLDATYKKEAKRSYPINARTLPVELEHTFAGKTDIFNMICYPRDP
jgi:hypothetical protein